MKCLAICTPGFEDICGKEISELNGSNIKILDSCIEFETKDIEKIVYYTQSSHRILVDVKEIDLDKLNNIKVNKKFAVRCIKRNSEESSLEIENKVGKIIEGKVDLEEPEVTVIVYITKNKKYLGFDYYGDISKRSYKTYSTPRSLKGPLAYSLIRFADYNKQKTFLDCFSGNGVIAIETTSYSVGKSVRHYDKDKLGLTYENNKLKENNKIYAFDSLLANVEKTKKNAKIAGIEKFFKTSKVDVEWLDTKLEENEIDIICSQFPEVSKRTDKKEIEKLYKEFFYQVDFILSKKGIIVALLHNPEFLIDKAEKFKVMEKREIFSGKDKLYAIKFIRR